MANVDINVGGKTLNVDIDGLETMSPEAQASAVDQVARHLAPAPSFKDDAIGGVHDLATGLSQTANAIGGVANRNGYTGIGDAATATGKFLSDHSPDATPANPANDVGAALHEGRYSDIPGAIAHSAVRMAPSVAPMLAAGAIPGVGPLLAGGIAGAESLGPTAYQRAQNNGRSEPDTSDVVGALPSTAVNAVAGAYLPGGGASRLAKPFIEAGTGAVMDASNQLGGSVGTAAGAHLDPYEMAGVGLTQGAIGAGRQVAPLAREGVKAAADNVMSRLGDQPVSVDDAASMSRVGKAYDAHLAAVEDTRGGSVRPTDVLNSMKQENLARTKEYARGLQDAGILPDGLSATISSVLEQARRHNNEIVDGGLDTSSLFDDIKNSGIHPDALQPLLNGIRDQNTLSKQSFLKNQTGPFQQLGNGISQLAAIGLPLSHGNLPGAAMALMGHGIVGKVGGIVGGTLDSALGTATPKILLQRMAADRYLKQNGADAGPNTVGSLNDANAALRDIQANQPKPLAPPPPENLPFTVGSPVPDPLAEAKARAKAWDKVQGKQTASDVAGDMDKAFPAPDLLKQQIYQSGANLPGQGLDPLRNTPSEAPGLPFDPQAQAVLDMSAHAHAAEQARKQQGINDLLNRIANRKVDAQSVDSLAQAKVDKFVKANSVALAAADKLPTDTVHSASVAGQAAMVSALDRAKAVLNRGNSATDELQARMAVGNPAGDLMGLGDAPQTYKKVQAPSPLQTPQPAPAPLQAPPMASPPVAAPVVSGPAPALNPETPAVQGRPWEQFIGKTLPGVTRAHVQEAVNAVHTPEMAAQINGAMGGVDREHLQPVIEHLRASQPGGNGTQEIAMPRQWEAAKASYQADVARQSAEARAVGLPDTAAALAEVGITKGRDAKATLRDEHLASILDAAKRSQAAAMFSRRLMNHGPK